MSGRHTKIRWGEHLDGYSRQGFLHQLYMPPPHLVCFLTKTRFHPPFSSSLSCLAPPVQLQLILLLKELYLSPPTSITRIIVRSPATWEWLERQFQKSENAFTMRQKRETLIHFRSQTTNVHAQEGLQNSMYAIIDV